MKELQVPLSAADIDALNVGDAVFISGSILAGRDAVLPKVCAMIENGSIKGADIPLEGGAVFHSAVSPAGIGPTSSNKVEIEGSFDALSSAGVRIHLGKGAIKPETVKKLAKRHACFAVTPPVSALFKDKTAECRVLAFPELGMEALHLLEAEGYPAIVAAVNGRSIFEVGEQL